MQEANEKSQETEVLAHKRGDVQSGNGEFSKNDIIIHAMPSPVSSVLSSRQNIGGTNGHDHKKTGMLIIIGGLVLIIGLAFAGYQFILKPNLASKNIADVPVVEKKIEDAIPNIVASLNTPTPAPAATSTIATSSLMSTTSLEVASGTDLLASTTNDLTVSGAELELKSSLDTDLDGLSDPEETIFGTDPKRVDTDGDNYSDLIEIQNGYDPAGNGKLETSTRLGKYSDRSLKYSLLYPKTWSVKKMDNGSTIVFANADESLYIQLIRQENMAGQDIMSWFSSQFPGQKNGQLKIGATWEGIYNEDQTDFYLTDKEYKILYVFSLSSASSSTQDFKNLLETMVNSLELK